VISALCRELEEAPQVRFDHDQHRFTKRAYLLQHQHPVGIISRHSTWACEIAGILLNVVAATVVGRIRSIAQADFIIDKGRYIAMGSTLLHIARRKLSGRLQPVFPAATRIDSTREV